MTAKAELESVDRAREENTEGLFSSFFPEPGGRAADDTTVRSELCQCRGERICTQVEEALKGRPLTPRQKGRIQLARHVVRDYFTQPSFHPELSRVLVSESGGLVALALASDSWVLQRSGHPVHELLTLVGRVGMGWSPGDRRAPKTRQLLCTWVGALGRGEDPETVVAAARKRLAEFDRVRERRVEDALEGQRGLSAAQARPRAAQLINQQLAGRHQPPFMARSLHTDWWPALQKVLMEQGESSELAHRLMRVLSLVIWALQPRETEAIPLRKLNRVAEEVSRELPLVLVEVIPELERREALVDRVDVALYSIIYGRQVAQQAVEPLSEAEPVGADGAEAGHWFERTRDGQRIWLARGTGDQSRIAFDFFGRRILQCSPAEWTRLLDAGRLQPVPTPAEPAELIAGHLDRLKRRSEERQPAKAG